MHDPRPLLEQIPFPSLHRRRLTTLQVNVGYRCNQSCLHCHVGASPHRTEEMSGEVVDVVLAFCCVSKSARSTSPAAHRSSIRHFRRMVRPARDMGVRVMDRCNLTILDVPGQRRPR